MRLILKPMKFGLLRIFFVMLLIGQLCAPAPALSQGAPDAKVNSQTVEGATKAGIPFDLSKKNVLLLHAYIYETAAYLVLDPIFVKGFGDAGLGAFNLHFEFVDLAKHPDPAHRREFVRYLGRKFEKHPIDLIIVLHSPGLSFLVEEGKDLFPGVPAINVIARAILENLYRVQGRVPQLATPNDWYMALAYTVRDRMLSGWGVNPRKWVAHPVHT